MNQSPFMVNYRALCEMLLKQKPIHTGSWQSIDTSASAAHATFELEDVTIKLEIPLNHHALQDMVPANQPWADTHFSERVGGIPLNPAPSHEIWPWARHNATHQSGDRQVFSHTYPERMWPREALSTGWTQDCLPGEHSPMNGIRFRYGDLADVVDLLGREPLTRQAYLPIWFPEDTGAHHRQRVPCTLGYHFMMREGRLSCRYFMRSCDILRHFIDDVYLAARLTQWVCRQVNLRLGFDKSPMFPGQLTMHISSLHAFVGDKYKLERIVGYRD